MRFLVRWRGFGDRGGVAVGGPAPLTGAAAARLAWASRRAALSGAWVAAALVTSSTGLAQVHLTQQQALRLAFPAPARIERRTAFLDDADLERARELAGAGVKIDGRLVTYYVGMDGETPLGVAYFDAHRVRTLREVLMIVVSPEGRVARIEVLRFAEPPEYEAPEGWLRQFRGRALSDDLSLKEAIVNITGATLTSRAVTRAVRRVLALHAVVRPFASDGSGAPQ
jgi:Na+-translocating ferredoxin:NAD+ oxidoreductase RnfG subunit